MDNDLIEEPREKPSCPYCKSIIGVVFMRFEGDVEVYMCHTCDTIFKILPKETK